jgi:hypothetical protein
VKLDREWFQQHFNVMRSLALLILLPLMLIGLISAIIHRDVGQLLRAGGVYVPVVVIGGALAIVLTEKALQLTDWATTFVTGDLHGSVNRAFVALADAVRSLGVSGSPDFGTFLAIIVLLVLMAGAVLIWIELLLRTSAIYVVVLFLPLAMSGLVWRGTVAWTRRMVEALVALLLSKFVIVVVLDLAAGMITAADGIGTIMQGATLLLLAACAPFALLRLVPIVEAGVIGHFERMERRPVAAASRATMAVARQVVLGAEASAAGKSVQGNGGDASARLNGSREPGGQLNNVRLPDGWDSARRAPTGSAAVSQSSAGGDASTASPGPAGTPGSPGSATSANSALAAATTGSSPRISGGPAPLPDGSSPPEPATGGAGAN